MGMKREEKEGADDKGWNLNAKKFGLRTENRKIYFWVSIR